MSKTVVKQQRSDAWSKDDEGILKECALRHIQENSPLGQAFVEASKQLSRTPGACSARWYQIQNKQEQEQSADPSHDEKEEIKTEPSTLNNQNTTILKELMGKISASLDHTRQEDAERFLKGMLFAANQIAMKEKYKRELAKEIKKRNQLESQFKQLSEDFLHLNRSIAQFKEKLEKIEFPASEMKKPIKKETKKETPASLSVPGISYSVNQKDGLVSL